MFFSAPLKRRADKIESRKNDASAQGARSVAPDGTGGFRGITIAVSAILLALKNNRSLERNFLLLTTFSITKKVHLTSNLQLPTRRFPPVLDVSTRFDLWTTAKNIAHSERLKIVCLSALRTSAYRREFRFLASGAIFFLCGCEPENDWYNPRLRTSKWLTST